MNYFMRITFPSTDDNTISSVRSEFAHRLRKMNLRYKSDIYYPESSWSTPAFGVPEELTFLIGAPKDKQVNYLEIEINPEKPDVPLNKNDAFQKVQKRHVQEKR